MFLAMRPGDSAYESIVLGEEHCNTRVNLANSQGDQHCEAFSRMTDPMGGCSCRVIRVVDSARSAFSEVPDGNYVRYGYITTTTS